MHKGFATAAAGAALALACTKVPYTGRTQYNLVPDSIMNGIGESSYKSMLAESKTVKGGDRDTLVKVGGKISKVAKKPEYDWQYTLIQDDEINAWCLPGGKIGFYTGILPVLQHEAGMAFVMGHEVGHATAHHGSERLSQSLTLIGGLAGLEIYMANATDLKVKDRAIILGALGVGGTLGILLPFSRMHESEADVIGMMYMASAGFPPAESTDLWHRMELATGKSALPAFLSTHPSNDKRIENLREWLPQAKKRFERNELGYDTTQIVWPGLDTGGGGKGGKGDGGGKKGKKGKGR
jgi:predicted Zn-dependent protease